MEISVGTILEGAVKSITNFGAFVTLPGGRSGLVHISEIAHTYVSDVRDHLTEGQEVKVKVVGIDDAGRINLSIKKASAPPPRAQNAPPRKRPARPDVREREGGGGRSGGNFSREPRAAAAPQPAGPPDFEARLKQFMQLSDSKLSDLRMSEKRSSRRSGHH
ncbi:MAG: S1 RNA-binding domain-containing protein [Ruminiclostridium sp.]|jgi:S1 RNA binding domain protein|nr:S1 RNA-binding domain-containing protein [Ruminiclostridium sp.]